jgi:hypothetical protein
MRPSCWILFTVPALALSAAAAQKPRASVLAPEQNERARFVEVRRFAAAEADQAVAVDAEHFYAIDNHAIGKYEKRTGRKVAEWVGAPDGPITHLNSGIVIGSRLYCAHSNYPALPMLSSIEVFDALTMKHVDSHSFGMMPGSATWIDQRNGRWWVGFANYSGNGGAPGRGTESTFVGVFDAEWRQVGGYTFPPNLVTRFLDRSNSGGTWGSDGRLYITGHDAAEVYAIQPPHAGSVLDLLEILPAPAEGQGIAWDPTEPGTLYTIVRSRHEVVVSRLARE